MFGSFDLSQERDSWLKLGDISKIYTGTTPDTAKNSYWLGDIRWISPAELKDDSFYIYETERHITEEARRSKSLEYLPVGTVILSSRAPIGKVGIVGAQLTINQGFKGIKSDRLNPVYLYTLLKLNGEYLISLGTGTTFLELSKKKVENIAIPVPNIKTQDDFSAFYIRIDKLKFVSRINSRFLRNGMLCRRHRCL